MGSEPSKQTLAIVLEESLRIPRLPKHLLLQLLDQSRGTSYANCGRG